MIRLFSSDDVQAFFGNVHPTAADFERAESAASRASRFNGPSGFSGPCPSGRPNATGTPHHPQRDEQRPVRLAPQPPEPPASSAVLPHPGRRPTFGWDVGPAGEAFAVHEPDLRGAGGGVAPEDVATAAVLVVADVGYDLARLVFLLEGPPVEALGCLPHETGRARPAASYGAPQLWASSASQRGSLNTQTQRVNVRRQRDPVPRGTGKTGGRVVDRFASVVPSFERQDPAGRPAALLAVCTTYAGPGRVGDGGGVPVGWPSVVDRLRRGREGRPVGVRGFGVSGGWRDRPGRRRPARLR